jgi:hypothetical protein
MSFASLRRNVGFGDEYALAMVLSEYCSMRRATSTAARQTGCRVFLPTRAAQNGTRRCLWGSRTLIESRPSNAGLTADSMEHDMYRIRISPAEERPESIVHFRQEICRVIGMDDSGPNAQPLDYATYLFVERDHEQVGMIELFFYDQCFGTYADAIYARAADLSALAPMCELAHVGSVIVDPPYRGTRAFLFLTAAMVLAAHRMGARYLTAATGVANHEILALHRNAGMTPLGRFNHDGSSFALSLLDVGSRAHQAAAILERHGIALDPDALQALRERTTKEHAERATASI